MRIKNLGDNEWLKLGTPKADPVHGLARGRSWGGRALILAPDLRGAFYMGEGVHAYVKPDGFAMDDIWLYDINQNRWVCVYPGLNTRTFNDQVRKGDFRIDDNGIFVTRDGQPIPAHTLIHSWDLLTYNSDSRKFATIGSESLGRYYLPGEKQIEEGLKILDAQRAGKVVPPMSPWFYDVMTGRFEHYPIKAKAPDVGGYPYFQYVPAEKKYYVLGGGGAASFDPESRSWAVIKDSGPRPIGYDYGGAFDSKRSRIYLGAVGAGVANGTGAPHTFLIFDPKTGVWSKPAVNGTSGPGSISTALKSAMYDTTNDSLVVFDYSSTRVSAYSFATESWSHRDMPPGLLSSPSYANQAAFYDPTLNAYFLHNASDSADNGVMWTYRFKKAP